MIKNSINFARRFGSKLRAPAAVGGGLALLSGSASAADGDYVSSAVTAISTGATQNQLIFGAVMLALVGLAVFALCKRALH
ncbi:major capsid protein [Luteibacter sp. PPL554]